MEMKSRLLAYAVIILLAGYFYSDYAKASDDLPDPNSYCLGNNPEKRCNKGDIITVFGADLYKYCDWRYQMIIDSNDTITCVYRGSERKMRR